MNARGGVRIDALRADSSSSISDALAQLRDLTRVEMIVCASTVQVAGGWALDRFHADDLQHATTLRRLLASYVMRTTGRFGWFDLAHPQRDERNVLVDLRQGMADDEFRASRMCVEVLRPVQLHRHHVIRSLICEGDTVLAWFAVFHPQPLTVLQHALLEDALTALRRRLASEHVLDDGMLFDAAPELL